jgi:NADP-dependent 3-hydroxy acid dehydrogenase YdfG
MDMTPRAQVETSCGPRGAHPQAYRRNRQQRRADDLAIPADFFAGMAAFDMSQPEDVDVNEILYRPTRQEY